MEGRQGRANEGVEEDRRASELLLSYFSIKNKSDYFPCVFLSNKRVHDLEGAGKIGRRRKGWKERHLAERGEAGGHEGAQTSGEGSNLPFQPYMVVPDSVSRHGGAREGKERLV